MNTYVYVLIKLFSNYLENKINRVFISLVITFVSDVSILEILSSRTLILFL